MKDWCGSTNTDCLTCPSFIWAPSRYYYAIILQKEQNTNLLQKGVITGFQPDAESSVEAVPRLVKDLSNLSVKEQSSRNRLDGNEVNSSLQLPPQTMQNSLGTPTLIDELFKVPTGKDAVHGMCTGNSTSDESFQYRRTAKVSSITSTYLIKSSMFPFFR